MADLSGRKQMRAVMKRLVLRLHELALRLGLIVLPKHYYVPIPDLHELRRTRGRWARRSEMRGVGIDLAAQAERLVELVQPFEPEYRANHAYRTATAGACGPGFGAIEAQALHGFVRGARPRRIVEVGSGVSTYCMIEAGRLNAREGMPTAITCIEPYPSPWLRQAPVELIARPIEEVPLELFDGLEAGDLLFIDSTHTVRVGGDVMRIVMEILPRLPPGVFIHFHDIYLPYDFQRDADRSLFQWMETALLHAYLIDNARIEIVFCLSQLHYDRPELLRAVFPSYDPEPAVGGLRIAEAGADKHFPSSIYLRTKAAPPAAVQPRPSLQEGVTLAAAC